jgi:hypothetical protein
LKMVATRRASAFACSTDGSSKPTMSRTVSFRHIEEVSGQGERPFAE